MIHDAVMYMTTEDDLRAAITTAFVHTKPGGAALFAPDCVRETFRDRTTLMQADEGSRALRGVEWGWDPDPADETFSVEYALLLRDGDDMSSRHDRHVEGLFTRAAWIQILEDVGYAVEMVRRVDDGNVDEIFLCRRSL